MPDSTILELLPHTTLDTTPKLEFMPGSTGVLEKIGGGDFGDTVRIILGLLSFLSCFFSWRFTKLLSKHLAPEG